MKNKRRKEAKLLRERSLLIKAAINNGALTRADICKATGLKQTDLANVFAGDRELFAEYQVIKRTIAMEASDAIHDIVRDKTHPQHFQACKFIVQNHKSDLDEVLEAKDSITLSEGEGSGTSRVTINFGS